MKLTGEEARRVVWGDHEDWGYAIRELTDGNNRWSIFKSGIFEHKPTGKFYEFAWSVGATEMQDEQPFEFEKEVIPVEVHEVEVTKKEWVVV